MDRRRLSSIAHEGLLQWSPLGEAAVAAIVHFVAPEADGRVLDVGCGRGETLLRVVERSGCAGVGVDSSPHAIELARLQAARVPAGRVEWHERAFDPEQFPPATFDGALCLGATQACGGLAATARAFRRLLKDDGCAVVADVHAVRPPDPEYLAFLGLGADGLTDLQTQRRALAAEGFSVAAVVEATSDDFDRYEEQHTANVERYFAEHPDDGDAATMLAHVRSWRTAHLRWGRSTLGFAAFLLRRDAKASAAHAHR